MFFCFFCFLYLGTAPIAVKDVLVHKFQVLKDLIEEFKALDIPTHHYHLNLVIVNERGDLKMAEVLVLCEK